MPFGAYTLFSNYSKQIIDVNSWKIYSVINIMLITSEKKLVNFSTADINKKIKTNYKVVKGRK